MTEKYKFAQCGCEFDVIGKLEDDRPSIIFVPNMDEISMDCPRTWDLIGSGNTKGIFQLENQSNFARKLKPRNIEHLAALISIIRPGVLESIRDKKSVTMHYIDRKNGLEEVTYFHPALKPALEKTYGEMIYQEQAMQISRDIAGFNLQQADELRKAIGKKKPELMAKIKLSFLEGAEKQGTVTKEEAEQIFEWIEKSQRYSFNKCVSGNTKFWRDNSKFTFKPTISEMFNIRNNIEYAKKTGHLSLYKKWKLYGNYGKCLSLCEDGRLRPNIIVDIKYSGNQPIFKVTLSNGAAIETTMTHKFPSKYGEQPLSKLKVGDILYIKGEYEHNNTKYGYSPITLKELHSGEKSYSGCGFPSGQNNPGYTNGAYTQYEKIRATLPLVCNRCPATECRMELHHKDGNRTNSSSNNLEYLCVSCHKKAHYCLGRIHKGQKGYPSLECSINSIEYVGLQDVYDVTMDDPNHTFVTSTGIVTSNSHAVSYAYNAYLSAFAKAHFSRGFFTSYLRYAGEKTKPYMEIHELVQNARLMGIGVEGPDLRHLLKHFKLWDKVIRFGFFDMKGIGDAAWKKIIAQIARVEKLLGKKAEQWSWLDFLIHFAQHVNATAIAAFINSGAISYMGLSRTRMMYEYKLYDKLTDRERNWILNYMTIHKNDILKLEDLLMIMTVSGTGKTGACASEKRKDMITSLLKTLKNPSYNLEDAPEWMASVEESLLGIPLTCTSLDACDTSAANCTCQQYIQGANPKTTIIAAKIDAMSEIKVKNGKNKGRKMAFLKISDLTGSIDAVVFSEVWDEAKKISFVENNVLIHGERSKDGGSFICKQMWQI